MRLENCNEWEMEGDGKSDREMYKVGVWSSSGQSALTNVSWGRH